MPFNLDDYEQVDVRLDRFYADWPLGRVVTVLLDPRAEGQYIVRAEIFRQEDGLPSASGLAEEREGSSVVNKTSALENCETSAIGRALANLGYAAKGKRPSREEMSKTSGEAAAESGTGRRGISPSPTSSSPAAGPAARPTAAAGEATTASASADAAGDPQSPNGLGEVPSAAPGPGEAHATEAQATLGPDQPGPPHYPLRPDECDHRNEKSGHLLRPRKSPRGPVCPRCGLSYITVTEGTTADLGDGDVSEAGYHRDHIRDTLNISLPELNHKLIAAADAVYTALDEYRTRNAAWVEAERDYRTARALARPNIVGKDAAAREDALFLMGRNEWFQAEMAKALRDTAKEALRACQAVLSGLQSVASAHREEVRLSMYGSERSA